MTDQPPASLALEKLGIPHRVFWHAGQVTSLEQAAQERGQQPEQVIRSILFRTGEDEYVMVLVGGPAQVSWKALRKYLGKSRISMASEDEVLSVTGYRIGTVSPFGLPHPTRILIDKSALTNEEVSTGSGRRNVGIILRSTDLQKALLNAETVSLTESNKSTGAETTYNDLN